MKPIDDDVELIAELEAMRPAPRPAFVAELDLRVSDRFSEPGGARQETLLTRLARGLQPSSWRRLAPPAGALAVAAIAIATAVVSVSEGGPETTAPTGQGPSEARPMHLDSGTRAKAAPAREPSASPEYSESPPVAESAASAAAPSPPRSGPYASDAQRRRIERSARIVLATGSAEVRAAAAEAFRVVHTYDGIVLSSSIRDRGEDEAGAAFDLLIPSGRLDDALADLSGIAEVRSRSDSTLDVTAPTVGLQERLRDSRARIESLLTQLAAAGDGAERASVEAELRAERARTAALRSRLTALQRRTHFSRVSLRIEGDAESAAARGGGGWGLGDALEDAGRILTTAAGVTVIGLAFLAPFLVILLLAGLGRRLWIRSSRERALD